MAIALVQSARTIVTSSNTAAASLTGVAAGNLMLVWAAVFPGATLTATCTDNQGNTYAQSYIQNDTTTGIMIFSYYAKNIVGGSVTVTVDPAGASSDITLVIAEISGADTTAPADQVATNRNNGTAPSVAVTTSTPGEGYFAMVSHDGTNRTLTEAGGWTLINESEGGSSDMPISVIWQLAAAGTVTASWTIGTGAVNWVAGQASFLAGSAPAAPFIPGTHQNAVYRM